MTTYTNHNGYSEDDDEEDLHFQDDDYNDNGDVDMAYSVHDTPSSSSYNNNNPFGGVSSASASNGLYNNNHNNNNNNNTINNNNNNVDNTTNNNNNSTQTGKGVNHKANFTEPKEKKKPGRKPVATCPALRKEQNRAAQRAFRDRKERHLHQLENMIKDLKNQHYLVTSRLQSEAHDLKTVIESLQSENFYLREVVFAFESALSKGNHIDILKTVKQELFRRHHQNRRASSTPSSSATPSSPGTDHMTPPPNVRSSFSPSTSSTLPTSPGTPAVSATAAASSLDTRPRTSSPLSPSMANRQTTPPKPTFSSSSPHHTPSPLGQSHHNLYQGDMDVSDEVGPVREHPINDDISEEGVLSMSGNILYKAPPLFIPDMLEKGGQLGMPVSPFGSISVPRPAYCPPGTTLPEKTEYTKHANVFEELQSSLFPPGTLESLHISMATPQEVVSEETPFVETIQMEADRATSRSMHMQMDRDRDNNRDSKYQYNNIQYDNSNGYSSSNKNRASSSSSSDLPMQIKVEPESDDETFGGLDAEQLRSMAASLGLKMETTKRHRLHRELQILIAAEPQTDPNIDPKVYELPHDRRIDYVPCPKLRAQMIVHQQRYNADELFQLLIDEAVCHGPPLHKDSWQLPEAFFDRFGFLLGLEFDRIRRKMWPVKYPK
ncbi:DNA-binding transcription factor yap1 [Linnemannia schmuckeri]|uniref:DNA-binding transcription factor yap1 n=1 Tax=Linnemannia schmuckeri TaxID=64567 RepID=A0A9P5R486_9FUNG|nr:DNA-binding transcription factor yap1 [Linnemannia schmuckeri]